MKHKASQEAFFVAARHRMCCPVCRGSSSFVATSGMLHSPFAHNEAAPEADNLPHGAVFPLH